jgi:hypothetical protein
MTLVDVTMNTPPVLIFNAALPDHPYGANEACESYPFEVSDRIVVDGKQYRHLVTLMSVKNDIKRLKPGAWLDDSLISMFTKYFLPLLRALIA